MIHIAGRFTVKSGLHLGLISTTLLDWVVIVIAMLYNFQENYMLDNKIEEVLSCQRAKPSSSISSA